MARIEIILCLIATISMTIAQKLPLTEIEDNGLTDKEDGTRRTKRMFAMCPPKFVRIGNECYYISTERVNWLDAHFECKDRNSKLAEPIKFEDKNLRKYLTHNDMDHNEKWIGGIYNWERNKWQWGYNGRDMSYQSFSQMIPGSSQDLRYHCAVLNPNIKYRWSAKPCVDKNPFVCQHRMPYVSEKNRERIYSKWNETFPNEQANEVEVNVKGRNDIGVQRRTNGPKNMRRTQVEEQSVKHFGQSMPLPSSGSLYRKYTGNAVSQHVNRKIIDNLDPETLAVSNTIERRSGGGQSGRRRRKNRFNFAPHQQAIRNRTPTSAMMLNNVPAMVGSIQTDHGKVVMENDIIKHQPIIEFAPSPMNEMKNTVSKPVNHMDTESDGKLTEYPNGDIAIKAALGYRRSHQHHHKQHVTTTEEQPTTTETIKESRRNDNVDEDDKRYHVERRRIDNAERRRSENDERVRLEKVKQDEEANKRKLEMEERDRIHKERQELIRLHEEERLRVEQEIKKREQEDADYFQQQENEKRKKQQEEAEKLQKIKEKEAERNQKRKLVEARRQREQEIQRQQEEESEHQTQTSSPSERRSFEDERKARRDRLRERLQKLSPEQQKQFFELRRERMKRKHDDKHYNDSFNPE